MTFDLCVNVWTKRSIWISPYLLSRSHPHSLYCLSYLCRPFIWDPDYSSSNKTQQFSSLNQENRKVGLFYWLFSASHQRTATEASLAQVSITDSTESAKEGPSPDVSSWFHPDTGNHHPPLPTRGRVAEVSEPSWLNSAESLMRLR